MKRNCLLLIASYPESIATFRGALICALSDAGVQVDVCAPFKGGSLGKNSGVSALGLTMHRVPLNRTGANPFEDLKFFLALCRLMRGLRPSISLPYTAKPVIYGTIAAWVVGVPRRFALVTGLGYAFTSGRRGMLSGIVRVLYRFALSKAHKVFFQNPDDERLFRELGLIPKWVPSVVINGSGVDLASFRVEPIPSGVSTFLLIARLLGDKGLREYVEAARRVKARNPEARFLLAGWIDTNPDAISQSELDDWIADGTLEFLGRLDDVRPAIAASSVYVLPSYREGTPRTVLEAMAMGRPIITTDAPGCRETVISGENGFLVPVKSVDALVNAMLRFVEDPALAVRMSARSREIAEEKYDVKKINAVILSEMGIASPGEEGANA